MQIFKDKAVVKMLSRASILLIIFLIAFKGVLILSEKVLINYHSNNPEELIKDVPMFQLLKKYEPNTYAKLKLDISNSLRDGKDFNDLKLKVQSYVNNMLTQRIPYSSNESIVDYMSVMIKQMEALRSKNHNLCYLYLFPDQKNPMNIADYVDQSILDEDKATLSEVIRSSYEAPQIEPDPELAKSYINQIYSSLFGIYGQQKVAVLLNPKESHKNKATTCDMTINLFNEILKLPVEQSGETLRYISIQNNI